MNLPAKKKPPYPGPLPRQHKREMHRSRCYWRGGEGDGPRSGFTGTINRLCAGWSLSLAISSISVWRRWGCAVGVQPLQGCGPL
jgi:hypothetical protein